MSMHPPFLLGHRTVFIRGRRADAATCLSGAMPSIVLVARQCAQAAGPPVSLAKPQRRADHGPAAGWGTAVRRVCSQQRLNSPAIVALVA